MHTQTVSGRKFFVKNKLAAFLSEEQNGQVLILAAGLAPLSVEIASLFPKCTVFDVDAHNMKEKETAVDGKPSNIRFIECDITNVELLDKKLLQYGFKPDAPTMAVMEGIMYYLKPADLSNILKYLSSHRIPVTGEFGLKPELVNEKTRHHLTEVFRKIKESVNLDFISYYSDEEITGLFRSDGYRHVELINMQRIQQERTGSIHPFESLDSSWIKLIVAE